MYSPEVLAWMHGAAIFFFSASCIRARALCERRCMRNEGALPWTDNASDAELLHRVAVGDGAAIGLLYDRYAGVLMGLATRILRDRTDAEDLLHDAFVIVSDRARQYDSARGSVASWLITLVRNLSIDRMRRRDRRGVLVREVLASEPAPVLTSPEELAGVAAERKTVLRALSSLPDVQRATLERAFFEGLSYSEIAEREGVPLGTVKSRAARALRALHEALGPGGLLEGPPAAHERPGNLGLAHH
jgi:RNA polymerase sigma-70 factor (ECF subfamily)